jgi:hypothetical protein
MNTRQQPQRQQQQRPDDDERSNGSATDQANAIAKLPPDMAILKLENESIMALAAARPRDPEAMKESILAQLKAFPVIATKLIYNKPVGRAEDHCTACDRDIWRLDKKQKHAPAVCPLCKKEGTVKEGEMKFARGLSIRAGEILAEAYRFNSVRTYTRKTDDGNGVIISATFVDYQNGRMWTDEVTVSRFYTNKKGDTLTHNEDRFLNVVTKAERSKVVREVIVRTVAAGMKAWLEEEAEKMIDEALDEPAVDKIVGFFSSKGVSLPQIERVIGRTRKQGWKVEDRRTLLGLWNAIEEGESTIAEAFGEVTDIDSKTSIITPPANGNGGSTPTTTADGNGGSTAGALTTPKTKAAKPAADTGKKPAGKKSAASAAEASPAFGPIFQSLVEADSLATLQAAYNEVVPVAEVTEPERVRLYEAIESHPIWLAMKAEAEAAEDAAATAGENQEPPAAAPDTLHGLLDRVKAATTAADLSAIRNDSARLSQLNTISMDAHRAVNKAATDRRKQLESNS